MVQCNVLRVNAVEEREEYRDAVAEILRNVQHDHQVTLLDIAERIDVSLGTISNAANKKADLCAPYLRRIGRAFGVSSLDPYVRSIGGRVMPTEAQGGVDILPTIFSAGGKIANARTASSHGGVIETLNEKLGYLPELRRLRREADALIAEIEAMAA